VGGNAACIVGAAPPSVDWDDLFYLKNVKFVIIIVIVVIVIVIVVVVMLL